MEFLYPDGLPVAMSLAAYNSFLTGFVVLLKRKDRTGTLYFISSLTNALWGWGISFMFNNHISSDIAQSWGRFANVVAFFIPVTWLHFVFCYTHNEEKYKKIRNIFYAITLIFFPLTLTNQFIPHYQKIVSLYNYPFPGPIYHVFALIFFVAVVVSFLVLYFAYKNIENTEKKKDYQYLGLASFYGYFVGGLSFLPVYGIKLPQYNLLLMPFWQILLSYVMIRHRIFDLEEAIQAAHRDKMAAIGMLAASMNHEIRNPLYIIRGLAETHLEKFQEGMYSNNEQAVQKANEILKKAAEQSDRAMDLMKRFSMFAKQNVDQQFIKEPTVISTVLEDILPLIQHELMLDQIELVKKVPGNLQITADRRHIEEILFNLIVNACQAIKQAANLKLQTKADDKARSIEGGLSGISSVKAIAGKIEIRAEQLESFVTIEIADNGPGIEENQQKKIFDPFYTSKEEGMGLGLYITKQLVERNGGKISVKSKQGKGTTFVLEFKA